MKGIVSRVLIIISVCLLMALPAFAGGLTKVVSKNAEAQKLIDEAWALEQTDSNAEIFKKCVFLLEQADKLDPSTPPILVELSRHHWNYGDNLPKETKEQQKMLEGIYKQGLVAAEKSLKLKETSGAHYWLAVNKSSGLEFSSIFSQAAAFPSIYSHSQYVKNNDPNYFYGASGRLWSEILSRVPKKVVELVNWDVQEAVDDINNAIKAEPRYLDNYLYKARFLYVYFEDKPKALEILEWELSQDPDILPEEKKANEISQRDAKVLWKKITGKDYPGK